MNETHGLIFKNNVENKDQFLFVELPNKK